MAEAQGDPEAGTSRISST